MSNEAQVRSGLQIRKQDSAGNVQLFYISQPQAHNEDVDGTFGPAPGAFLATTAGTDVDLSQFSTPGLYRVMNLDATNFVEVGIRDPLTDTFYPMHEVLPGKTYVNRLSRNLREAFFPSTGTGTSGPVNALHVKAHGAACNVLFEIFEA